MDDVEALARIEEDIADHLQALGVVRTVDGDVTRWESVNLGMTLERYATTAWRITDADGRTTIGTHPKGLRIFLRGLSTFEGGD